jgi:hypothetical protein
LPWKYAAGQFILIVVGVLVALSADSFREERGEQRREAAYLEDLFRDLEVTLNMVDRSIAADSQHIARSRSMLTYLRSTEDAPQDSLRQWRGVRWPGFATVTGTMRALLETGDLRLLSGEMRRSLLMYATDHQYAEREIDRAIAELMLAQRFVREREETYTRWGRLDSIAGRAFTLNGPQMRTDPQLRAAYTAALSWQQFYLHRLLDFRVVVMGLRKAIEAEGRAATAVSTDTR